ncbi:hypothetical protein K474DRAFT_1676898 [Panus rudis PR-1116 ss-1]|nr:hypothetical protein K474DRAFT_1676898 [Panus rudis PR-1116 ss-1]
MDPGIRRTSTMFYSESERTIPLRYALRRRTNESDLTTVPTLHHVLHRKDVRETWHPDKLLRMLSCGVISVISTRTSTALLITKLEGGVVQLRPRSFVTGWQNGLSQEQPDSGVLSTLQRIFEELTEEPQVQVLYRWPHDQSGHGTLYGLTDKRTAAQNALVSQSEDGPPV